MWPLRNQPDPRADYRALLLPHENPPPDGFLKGTPAIWWGLSLSLASLAAAFWSCWSWWPALSAPVEIAVPPLLLATAAALPQKFTLGPNDPPERRSSLFFGLIAAMLGLAMGAWREFRLLIIDQTLVWPTAVALATGGLIALVASRIDRNQMSDMLMLAFAGGAGALWATGVLLEVNGHVHHRIAAETPVEVVDKQVWRGGRGSTSYHLWLRANPAIPPASMTVGRPLYERAPIGARLCVIRTIGALHLAWWQIGECGLQSTPA